MKTKFLFPHKYKTIGWILLLPSLVLGIMVTHMEFEFGFLEITWRENPGFFESGTQNFTNELAGISVLLSLIFIGFSKMKTEDEYTIQVRLDSLLWSIYMHYAVVLIAFLTIYEGAFFTFMVYNIYTLLIIYIARFHFYFYRR